MSTNPSGISAFHTALKPLNSTEESELKTTSSVLLDDFIIGEAPSMSFKSFPQKCANLGSLVVDPS